MHGMTDGIMAALLVLNLALLGTSRLAFCITLVAAQGVLTGLLPLVSSSGVTLRTLFLAAAVIALKGVVFPRLLSNAIRGADVRREVEPYVGWGLSLLLGLGLLGISFWLGAKLPLPAAAPEAALVVPGAICTILIGLLVIVSRKKAVTQVAGYLVLENGIAAFGLAVVPDVPLLIELGILLDVFVAVFVMAIMIYRISQEFDHIDADRLSALKG
ncbi:MAG TPA: hydrogenase [Planctomycetes bacterium]|nr:hydrogenase [Planctomycetota bacterium]